MHEQDDNNSEAFAAYLDLDKLTDELLIIAEVKLHQNEPSQTPQWLHGLSQEYHMLSPCLQYTKHCLKTSEYCFVGSL